MGKNGRISIKKQKDCDGGSVIGGKSCKEEMAPAGALY